MIYFRIILILYILPLMALSALALMFKKTDWIKYAWIYGTLFVLIIIIFAKILFSVVGLFE